MHFSDISTLPEDDSTDSPDTCGSHCQTSHQVNFSVVICYMQRVSEPFYTS